MSLPNHMSIVNGHISTPTISPSIEVETDCHVTYLKTCHNCKRPIEDNMMTCVNEDCNLISHIMCLSALFLGDSEHLIPIGQDCPLCYTPLLWGDLVSKLKQKKVNNLHPTYNSKM